MLCGTWDSWLGGRRELECPAFPKTLLEEFPEARGKVWGLNPGLFVKGSEDNEQLGVCDELQGEPAEERQRRGSSDPFFVPNYYLCLITLHFPAAALSRGLAAPRAWQQEGRGGGRANPKPARLWNKSLRVTDIPAGRLGNGNSSKLV